MNENKRKYVLNGWTVFMIMSNFKWKIFFLLKDVHNWWLKYDRHENNYNIYFIPVFSLLVVIYIV